MVDQMRIAGGAAEELSEMQRHEGFGERRRRRFTLGGRGLGRELLAPIAAGTCVECNPCPSQKVRTSVASGRPDLNGGSPDESFLLHEDKILMVIMCQLKIPKILPYDSKNS